MTQETPFDPATPDPWRRMPTGLMSEEEEAYALANLWMNIVLEHKGIKRLIKKNEYCRRYEIFDCGMYDYWFYSSYPLDYILLGFKATVEKFLEENRNQRPSDDGALRRNAISMNYRGYKASIEWNEADNCYDGRVTNMDHANGADWLKGFQSLESFIVAFEALVDRHLEDCGPENDIWRPIELEYKGIKASIEKNDPMYRFEVSGLNTPGMWFNTSSIADVAIVVFRGLVDSYLEEHGGQSLPDAEAQPRMTIRMEYRGHKASIEWNDADHCYDGRVTTIDHADDAIWFEGFSPLAYLIASFKGSIDMYLKERRLEDATE